MQAKRDLFSQLKSMRHMGHVVLETVFSSSKPITMSITLRLTPLSLLQLQSQH